MNHRFVGIRRVAFLFILPLCALLAGCATLSTSHGGPTHLVIAAEIDGSDKVTITRAGAKWEHLSWQLPTNVTINGIKWSLTKSLELDNAGKTQFLSPDVNFSSARVVSRKGRDIVAMEKYPDKIVIYFGDNPNGDAPYRIDIAFDE